MGGIGGMAATQVLVEMGDGYKRQPCNYAPGLWQLGDISYICSLIAPRPLFIENGLDVYKRQIQFPEAHRP